MLGYRGRVLNFHFDLNARADRIVFMTLGKVMGVTRVCGGASDTIEWAIGTELRPPATSGDCCGDAASLDILQNASGSPPLIDFPRRFQARARVPDDRGPAGDRAMGRRWR